MCMGCIGLENLYSERIVGRPNPPNKQVSTASPSQTLNPKPCIGIFWESLGGA